MKKPIALLMAVMVTLTGCNFELSPWQTDANCSPSVSIAANIQRLAEFEQQVGPRSEYKVALLSDPQQYPGSFEKLIKHINGLADVDFILLTGDLADTGLKSEYEWACKAMEKSKKPIFAVMGNHDTLAFAEEIWADVFGPTDYSFTYQGSKFIAYNDNKYEFENVPDRNWLADEAAGADDRRANGGYTFAVSHIPPWDEDLQLSQDLKDMGFNLGIHGHTHRFDYWQIQNVLLPHYITINTKEDGFGMLTVNPAGLTLENCDRSRCEVAQPRTRTQ